MLGLMLATLWHRRTQTALLFLLALVAAAGAATAPGYVVASLQSLAVASVADSPAIDRVVEARVERELPADLAGDLSGFMDRLRGEVGLPAAAAVSGASMVAVLDRSLYTLAYRDDVCAHLAIEGSCPAAAGELLLAWDTAEALRLGVGDAVGIRGRSEVPPVPMTLVGMYRAVDPSEGYWGRPSGGTESLAHVGIFTPAATFGLLRPNRVELSADLVVSPSAYRSNDPQALADAVEVGALHLGAEGIAVNSGLPGIADRLREEQRVVITGTMVGAGELLVACWLALFLAVRRTADGRRADIGLLKLRGTRRRDLWALVAAQSLLPVMLAGVIGAGMGPWLARQLAGPVAQPGALPPLWTLAAAAAGLAVLGAAAVAFAAERRTVTAPVAVLSRPVGTSRPGRAAYLFDAIVVLLAVAGAYQTATAGGQGVGLLAPLLVALAVGVLAARLLPMAANRLGGRALRSGRLGTGLAAMHLGRRAGTASVLGVIVVVVATLVTTALAWSVASASSRQRAVAEVGAARVLSVRASSPGHLLTAVRAADPSGTAAMAVVRTDAAIGSVLALDTTRLAAVAPHLDAYGLSWKGVAAALRPGGYEPVEIRGEALTAEATWAGDAAVTLTARVVTAEGPVDFMLGGLQNGRHAYAGPAPGCAEGCRLVSLKLSSTVGRPADGSALTVHHLGGLTAQVLADRVRWRASVTAAAQVPEIAAGPDGLSIGLVRGIPADRATLDVSVYVVDAPTPLPVVRAGEIQLDRTDPRTAVIGNDVLPVRIAGSGLSLPEIRSGLLVDLEYADRLAATAQRPAMQVWLADSAPAQIERDLVGSGVIVLGEEGIDDRTRALNARGPVAALRFLLVTAIVMLGLAILSFGVSAASELRPRGTELAALRRQGMPAAVVRRVGFLGYGVFAVAAVVLGALTGLAVRFALPSTIIDVESNVDTFSIATLAGVVAGALAPLLVVAVIAGAGLVAAARPRSGESS